MNLDEFEPSGEKVDPTYLGAWVLPDVLDERGMPDDDAVREFELVAEFGDLEAFMRDGEDEEGAPGVDAEDSA